jgi:hypothetical protein
MRVFIQNVYPEALMIPGEETSRWVPKLVGDGGEYDQFVQQMQAQTWDPPIPTVADPLCYTLKLREKAGAGLVKYLVGTYYGDETARDTAFNYVNFKYATWPSLPIGATMVVLCTDDTHPVTHLGEILPNAAESYDFVGYWLASDPDTFVPVGSTT